MSLLLLISCAALLVWFAVLSLAAHEVLMEVAKIKKSHDSAEESRSRSVLGELIPSFRVPLLESDATLTDRELRDSSTALLFIDAEAAPRLPPRIFATAVYSLLQRVSGRVYIVCDCPEERCRALRNDAELLHTAFATRTDWVLDPAAALRSAFAVDVPWTATLVDEHGRLFKQGVLAFPEK